MKSDGNLLCDRDKAGTNGVPRQKHRKKKQESISVERARNKKLTSQPNKEMALRSLFSHRIAKFISYKD